MKEAIMQVEFHYSRAQIYHGVHVPLFQEQGA